jgi:PhzF family phenazine biosynthesis protein
MFQSCCRTSISGETPENQETMSQTLHIVDAFTDKPFSGNPAAVCLLDSPADETWMTLVAREMNLSETAFLHPIEGGWSLRWFTPKVEVKLCGHATLASAFTLWETGVVDAVETLRFHTLSGWLTCRRVDEWIEMDFPAKVCEPCPAPVGLADALGCELVTCGLNGMDCLVEVADEKTLRALQPDFTALAKLPVRGVIATCSSEAKEFDFISRFFAPAAGVNEDPVTGSAHCALGPYWQAKLGLSDFTAYQASERGGIVKVGMRGERVLLRGQAVMMSKVKLRA